METALVSLSAEEKTLRTVGFLFVLILVFIGVYLFQAKRDNDRMKSVISHLKNLKIREKSTYICAMLNQILIDRGEEAIVDTSTIYPSQWFASFVNDHRISATGSPLERELFETMTEYKNAQRDFLSQYQKLLVDNKDGFRKLLLEKKASDIIYLNAIAKELKDEHIDDV